MELTDEHCDAIVASLDRYARDCNSYEMGLPVGWSEGHAAAMRERIRKAIKEAL